MVQWVRWCGHTHVLLSHAFHKFILMFDTLGNNREKLVLGTIGKLFHDILALLLCICAQAVSNGFFHLIWNSATLEFSACWWWWCDLRSGGRLFSWHVSSVLLLLLVVIVFGSCVFCSEKQKRSWNDVVPGKAFSAASRNQTAGQKQQDLLNRLLRLQQASKWPHRHNHHLHYCSQWASVAYWNRISTHEHRCCFDRSWTVYQRCQIV